jgi:hypothetical protein
LGYSSHSEMQAFGATCVPRRHTENDHSESEGHETVPR